MASNKIPTEIENILRLLDLQQYYPELLSKDDLYQITSDDLALSDDKSTRSVSWQFINNVTRYNYHARSIKQGENTNISVTGFRQREKIKRDLEVTAVHPLDVIALVFLCCDPTARQDLVMHMWGCKFSLPFLFHLPGQLKPSVYIWPLRTLIGQFSVNDSFDEMPLIEKPMKGIAFLRVGDKNEISKSSILNHLIGGAEKAHPMFFHRNSEGSKRDRSKITNGMMEIGWFLPTDSRVERLNGPRLFVNLRINSTMLTAQRKIIGKLATVSIVLTTVEHLNNASDTIQDLLDGGCRVILMLSDSNINDDLVYKYLDDNSFSNLPSTHLEIITTSEKMLSDILDVLFYHIKQMESDSKREICLADFAKALPLTEFCVDEVCEMYVQAFKKTNDIVAVVKETDAINRKEKLLPLQETFWKEWSKYDRDFWRYSQLNSSEKAKYSNSRENVEIKMSEIRKEQYEHVSKYNLSRPMLTFVEALTELKGNTRKIFLRKLKLDLDQLSRCQLRPLERTYQKLVHTTVQANEIERSKINEQLADLDFKKSKISFGLEHIIREIGQLYEACTSQLNEHFMIAQNISYTQLPSIACFLIMDGYPIEILDGESCSVPLSWLEQVFRELPGNLKNNSENDNMKINVISVLGIQSSGKSTFLNTIFGFQFAVSAGRCTRGAFMQLVKISDSMKEKLGADYIFAIDTEGLKAAELTSEESIKHDNELSTFVIGLADTTVINLMGENANYLQDNLPIAVHAFLRMNLVGLHPRCSIVHHNVNKRDKEKLLDQGRLLESVLNKLTIKACDLEKVPPRFFYDIIEFSISEHTDYIPALYEGEQPMAPISTGYSKEAEHVKTKILKFCSLDKERECRDIRHFANHLKRLWQAIKRDRFVYEFRTTFEAEVRLEIDNKYLAVLLGYFGEIDESLDTSIKLLSSRTKCYEDIEKSFITKMVSEEEKYLNDLEQFISKKHCSECFEQWRKKYLYRLKDKIEYFRNSAIEQLSEYNKTFCISIPMIEMEKFFIQFAEKCQSSKKSKEECFSEIWQIWVFKNTNAKQRSYLASDTIKALEEVCHSHTHLIQEAKIEQCNLECFEVQDKHVNHNIGTDFRDILPKVLRIICSVKEEYINSVNGIKQKNLPYTDRIPKQVLLKVSKQLSDMLSIEDKSNEIAYQFKIDLLVHIAGSIVKDLKYMLEPDYMLGELKEKMKQLAFEKEDEIKEECINVIDIIFDIILTDIRTKANIISLSRKAIRNTLLESSFRGTIESKQALLGYCLNHILKNSKDNLLDDFIHSPKKAVCEYLEYVLNLIICLQSFKPTIKSLLNDFVDLYKKIVGKINDNVCMENFLNIVLQNSTINENLQNVLKLKNKKFLDINVKISIVNLLFQEKLEQFIENETEHIKEFICFDEIKLMSVLASEMCTRTLGCTALCPFCSEICKFSANHEGNHECLIHRPIVFSGRYLNDTSKLVETCPQYIIQKLPFPLSDRWICLSDFQRNTWNIPTLTFEEPSVIWMWILVNKFSVLKINMGKKSIDKLPKKWKTLSLEDVKRTIMEQVRFFPAERFVWCNTD